MITYTPARDRNLLLRIYLIGVRGKPERDMESLRMMGWGLMVVESSSVAVVVVAVVVAVAPQGGGEGRILGFSSKNIEYRHFFYQGVFFGRILNRRRLAQDFGKVLKWGSFFWENFEPPEARSRLWQGFKIGDRFLGRNLNRRRL